MKRFCPYLFLFVFVLLSSCSPYTLVESKVLNNADMTQYKTYRFAPVSDDMSRYINQIDYYNITNAIKSQMQMRGFRESESAPLEINIGITIRDNIETKDVLPPVTPYFFGARASYWRNYYSDAKLITDINKEGILMMDMLDVRSNKYLYTAAIGNVVDKADHKIKDQKQLDEAAKELFKKFPVKPVE